MQFLILAYDGTDSEAKARRMAARAEHLALGDMMKEEGALLFATAILDDEGSMIGSMLVVEFISHQGVDSWLAIEPYVTGKVWKEIKVQPCKVGPSFSTKKPTS